jgi:TPR repeat protein
MTQPRNDDVELGLAALSKRNYAEAELLLLPAAEKGDALAQCLLGNLYQLGLGVEVDTAKAISWYRKSAEQGYGLASSNLAGMLTDRVEIEYWQQKAIEQGFYLDAEESIVSRWQASF